LPPSCCNRADPPCLYCGKSDFAPLFSGLNDRLGFVPGDWAYVRCQVCGSANLRPFPRAEDVPGFYPPVYTFSPELARGRLQRLWANCEYRLLFRPIYRAQVNTVERHVGGNGTNRRRLLDVGCGRGLRLLEFRRRGFDVHGMDFVQDSVDYLRENHNVPGVCTDIAGLPHAFTQESFDVVTAFAVVEHLIDVVSAIRTCLSLVRRGGWLVLQMPFIDSVQASVFRKRWQPVVEAPRHITLPTVKGVRLAFSRVGVDQGDVHFVSESALANGAVIPISLFSHSSTTHVFGRPSIWHALSRVAAGALILPMWPWGAVENWILRRPAQWLVLVRKGRSSA
jgi:SAM-dependent methyltransferase